MRPQPCVRGDACTLQVLHTPSVPVLFISLVSGELSLRSAAEDYSRRPEIERCSRVKILKLAALYTFCVRVYILYIYTCTASA